LAQKALEIQLAWTEYKVDKWTKKQTTKAGLNPSVLSSYSFTLDTSVFSYSVDFNTSNSDGIAIVCYIHTVFDEDSVKALSATMSSLTSIYSIVSIQMNNLSSDDISHINGWVTSALSNLQLLSADASIASIYSRTLSAMAGFINEAAAVNLTSSSDAPDRGTFYGNIANAHFAGTTIAQFTPPYYSILQQGAFVFDGSQSSVLIDVIASDYNQDPYNFSSTIYTGCLTNNYKFSFSNQNITSYLSQGLDIVVSEAFGTSAYLIPLLGSNTSSATSYTVSLTPDCIPLYSLNVAANNFQKLVLFCRYPPYIFCRGSTSSDSDWSSI
jgi:hypothetical protein